MTADTLIAVLAVLVAGFFAGIVYADRVARAREMAALTAAVATAKADGSAAEQRVRDLVLSIQGVHNTLTTQVADLTDRFAINSFSGRASGTNPSAKTAGARP